MTDAPKRRGRPPKSAQEAQSPVVMMSATNAASVLLKPAHLKTQHDHDVDEFVDKIVDQARTQPEDAAYVESAAEEDRIERAQEAAPPLTQHQNTRRRTDPNKSVGVNELEGLKAEAWDAYEGQDERVRFDTLNRKWTFRPEQTNGHAEMLFELRRGEDVREVRLSNLKYGIEGAREISDKVVVDLDGAL